MVYMKKPITITLAKIGDLDKILEIRKRTWLSTYPNRKYKISRALISKIDFTSVEKREGLKRRLFAGTSRVWVAKAGTAIVGYGSARKYRGAKPNYLHSLYLLPRYQRKGIGNRLMQEMLGWLGQKRPVLLQVAAYNAAAIAFYKKFGFKVTGPTESVPTLPDGRKIPSIEMVLDYSK